MQPNMKNIRSSMLTPTAMVLPLSRTQKAILKRDSKVSAVCSTILTFSICLLLGKGQPSAPTVPVPIGPLGDVIGPDGLLKDIEVIELDAPIRKPRADRTQDIKAFFSAPYLKNDKKYRDCHACIYLFLFHVHLINNNLKKTTQEGCCPHQQGHYLMLPPTS